MNTMTNLSNFSDNSYISEGASRYGDFATGVALGIKSMRNSTCRCGGNLDKSFLPENTYSENLGTDISEITRKPSKTSKHGHENGRVYKSRKPKPEKSSLMNDFSSGNPTSTSEPFTSEFTLERNDAFLYDKLISLESDHDDCDPEEDIYVLKQLLNDDPFQLPPMDLKQSEVTEAKSSIEEPPELELKDLPSHLEYAFLEENDKLPVIIAKGLKNDQKDPLIGKVKDGVNPKIHEVINNAVIKLFDAGMIYHPSPTMAHAKLHQRNVNELRDQAYENSLIYKEKTKKLHDSKIKNRIFNVGDQVLLFNSRLNIFSGKLKTRWSGPFTIAQVFPYGTVELSQPDGPNFKVNGHRVKHYFGGDIPPKVVPDLHTLLKDN
ncbi:hypothetical protein Tco_1312421 [Tanacetum coccineum]